jgi:ubiquinone/menaquinone biosynthesis C-methylase UbiE
MLSPTQRFSNRVANYVRYRPSYPRGVIEMLRAECDLTLDSVVADIGSGTGKLTELLLPHAKRVVAIEPNLQMRQAGERLLQTHSNFVSVAGTAEATTLAEHSVDLIVAGQAFHWFDRARTKTEFGRILKPGGRIALIWNDLQTNSTPFLVAYEALLHQFAPEYEQVNHRHVDLRKLREFFGSQPQFRSFPYLQNFDFSGLRGRLLSSSYVPVEGNPGSAAMLTQLRTIFDAHQLDGQVVFLYDTLVYFGQLA